eukprot:CAMPEP_0113723788 /NCGR_PEP_ID=MMETSP0038_2-20120614/38658_1 /TAXON_ID=2898 /ORGANISM="Cryptomonas paramecium" /LENGTH=45 /DNA_ID=CAMNT_0000653497 /DNA_START=164 /DNA_END=298 /DNA_ORIENTATION=- /assembly_acc=CAM_ASM_000170
MAMTRGVEFAGEGRHVEEACLEHMLGLVQARADAASEAAERLEGL